MKVVKSARPVPEADNLFCFENWKRDAEEIFYACAVVLLLFALLWILVPIGLDILGPASGSLAGAK